MEEKQTARTVTFWLRPELEKEIGARGDNRSFVIHRDMERLYALYGRSLREVGLSLPEAWFLADMLNGSLMDATSASLLWASAEDACALDGLDGKWELDGKAFVEKLKGLSSIQAMALIDAAERFWQATAKSTETEKSTEAGDTMLRTFFGAALPPPEEGTK